MGRRREHDEHTALALLEAAERISAVKGVDAVSVRALTEEVGTTTRAVYTLFGSKEGLIAALGARAFDVLAAMVSALPRSTDPKADLVEAGALGFRQFVITRPALFALGIQQGGSTAEQRLVIRASAAHAFTVLEALVARIELGDRGVRQAATTFDALCEGLADLELRGVLPAATAEEIWRDALTALVDGLTSASSPGAATAPDRLRGCE